MKHGIIVTLVLLITLTGALPSQEQNESIQPRVWIPEYCGFTKGVVEFTIQVENDIPLTTVTFDVLFDENLFSGPSIFIDERAHGCFMYWASVDGGVRIAAVCDSVASGSGPLIHFRYGEPESLECRTSIQCTISNFALTDGGGSVYENENLTASLPVRYLGDVTGDCEINVLDALVAAHAIIGLDLLGCDLWAMDVNNDNQYNILDVLAIIDIVLGYGYPE